MASRGRSRLKDRSLEKLQALSNLEQLFQMKAKKPEILSEIAQASDKAEASMGG